jgi:hypothetical protein
MRDELPAGWQRLTASAVLSVEALSSTAICISSALGPFAKTLRSVCSIVPAAL